MKLPYLLLTRADLEETPTETARRRARTLTERLQRVKYEEALRAELIAISDLRDAMRTTETKRRWLLAAE